MRASQAGYGALTDKRLSSIARTDLLDKEGRVYNSAGKSLQFAAVIMDILNPDYVERISHMHLPRPDSTIDMTL